MEKGRKKLEELNLKKNMRDKTTEKPKQQQQQQSPQIDLASLGLGLKGMKMNPKRSVDELHDI
jgi:hypothetical protein